MRKLIILSFVSLCTALTISYGLYDRVALLFVVVSYVMLLAVAYNYVVKSKTREHGSMSGILLAALLFLLGLWLVKPLSIHIHSNKYEGLSNCVAIFAIVGCLLGYFLVKNKMLLGRLILVVVGLLPVVLWLLLPVALLPPGVDVYAFHQAAGRLLVEYKNPYSTLIGTPTYFKSPAAYTYPPANLYFIYPFYMLLGDVRYAQMFSVLVCGACLWFIARRYMNVLESDLLVLSFFYNPRLISVIHRSYSELFILAPLGVMLLLYVRNKKSIWVPVLAGITFSIKQYFVFAPVVWFVMERKFRRWLLLSAGVILPMLPFLALDFRGTVQNGLMLVLKGPYRVDSLTLLSLLYDVFGYKAPDNWTVWVGVGSAILVLLLLRKFKVLSSFVLGITIMLFTIFIFGRQAFNGYYYLITVLLLFLFPIINEREEREASF